MHQVSALSRWPPLPKPHEAKALRSAESKAMQCTFVLSPKHDNQDFDESTGAKLGVRKEDSENSKFL